MKDGHTTTRAPMIIPLEKRLMLDASIPVLTGQVLWLDAADKTTVRDADGDNAATGTGGANNGFGGTVQTWVDKSGSGFNVTAASASERPTYVNTKNGNSVITFDGINDKLTNAAASIAGNDFTAFVVFDRTNGGASRSAVYELGAGGSRNAIFYNNTANKLSYYLNSGFFNYTANYVPGNYALVTTMQDVTAITGAIDGANQLTGTGVARTTTTGIFIADDSTSNDWMQGHIAEFIVYDRDLTADERHDVETYLAAKWGLTITNTAPVVATNTGATLDQGTSRVITSAMLNATDADNTDSTLKYTITDLSDYGTLTNTNTSHTYVLGETFTQDDINNGYITYTHDGTANFADSFSVTVTDQYATTVASTFNLTITPVNDAPDFQGWTLVSSEDFQSGATGWSDNFTETSNPYFTRFLGRHSGEGGAQLTYKTYTLSGTQDYAIISFDMYRFDSWDGEQFRIYVDDAIVYSQSFTNSYVTLPDGSSGSVSWTIQETTPFSANVAFGSWTDQIFRFTMRVNTTGGTLKLGFSSTLDQAISDESWGVDNLNIYTVGDGGTPGPFHISEVTTNGSVVGTLTAVDPDVADTLTYSVTGGTGMGIFGVNATTGVITVLNASALNYESVSSYTLNVRVTDNGVPPLYDDAVITINLIDVPENTAPVLAALGPLTVAENAAVNTVVGTASATDVNGNTITYSISAGNTDNIFAINSSTGAIRIASTTNLNYEWDNSYTLTIVATDNGFGNLTHSRNVTINITNVNEAPTFNVPQSFLNQNPYLRYNATTGNFYQYVGTAANYATATSTAAGMLLNGVSGHIATIMSAAENTYVRGLGSGALWLAGSDLATEGTWIWASGGTEAGQIFSIGATTQAGYYTNWTAGQPDDSGNSDYLEMATSGQWTDVVGTGTRAYVVEWEGAAVLAALGNGPFSLAENPVLNQSVGFVHARDADAGDTLTYSITGGTGAAHFTVNSTTGEITVTNPSAINYESATSFTLNLQVQDALGLTGTQTVTINITDVNEAPVLNPGGPFTIAENAATNSLVGTMSASDVDGNTLTYSITAGNANGIFSINSSGQIRIANTAFLNHETATTHTLTIRVTDNGTGALFDSEVVTINVTNVNEAPSFDAVQRVLNANPGLLYSAATGNFYRYVSTAANITVATANASVALLNGEAGYIAQINSAAESTFIRSFIPGVIWANGSDTAVEGEWRYIGGPNSGELFWLGTSAGSAQNGNYTGWSGGEPNNSGGNEDYIEFRTNGTWNDTSGTGARAYVIEWEGTDVLSGMDNGPYSIDENSANGSVVGSARANDADIGDAVTYTITGGTGASVFSINATTGQIRLNAPINYEAVSSYTLDLRADDMNGGFDTLSITIDINDINDVPSNITLIGNSIVENSPVGTLVGTLSTADQDPADTHVYTLVSNPGGKFTIVGNEIYSASDIDYEATQNITLVIRSDDGNGGAINRTFVIQVGDVMDTYTPPPARGPAGSTDTLAPPQQEEEELSLNLLSASLGGEQNQARAFYGSEGLQILRENITFKIREFLGLFAGRSHNIPSGPGMLDADTITERAAEAPAAQAQHYTNLREAIEFLRQMDESTKDQMTPDAEDAGAKNLPKNALDRQFVDVMTYHQERAAHLRKALLDAA